jgi:hypothetical protein
MFSLEQVTYALSNLLQSFSVFLTECVQPGTVNIQYGHDFAILFIGTTISERDFDEQAM